MSAKALPNWVKVDKKDLIRLKRKFKMLKIIIYKLDQIVVALLVLMNYTD